MKGFLSENEVKFAYVDICAGVGSLKLFLKWRDTLDIFEDIRREHRAGIPALLVDDKVYLIDGVDQLKQLLEELDILGTPRI